MEAKYLGEDFVPLSDTTRWVTALQTAGDAPRQISHLSGKRLCMKVNNSRGVSTDCFSFSSPHLSITLCKSPHTHTHTFPLPLHFFLIQFETSLHMPPPLFHTPFSSPHTHEQNEQMASKLKSAVLEHQTKHRSQIPQTNASRKAKQLRNRSCVCFSSGGVPFFPSFILLGVASSSAQELCAVLMCLLSSCLSVCSSG